MDITIRESALSDDSLVYDVYVGSNASVNTIRFHAIDRAHAERLASELSVTVLNNATEHTEITFRDHEWSAT